MYDRRKVWAYKWYKDFEATYGIFKIWRLNVWRERLLDHFKESCTVIRHY